MLLKKYSCENIYSTTKHNTDDHIVTTKKSDEKWEKANRKKLISL